MTSESYSVFLSYNADDRDAVEQVAIYLEDGVKLIPWFDQWHLIPGEPWVRNLERGIANSSSCAVFVGKSGEGPWQMPEVEAVLREQVRNPQFRVIPVLLPDATKQPQLPTFLAGNTWVDFRSGLEDDNARWRLECGIKGIAPGRGRPQTSEPLPKEPEPIPEKPAPEKPSPEEPPVTVTTSERKPSTISVRLRRILKHKEGVKAVAFSPDGKIIAGGAGQSFFPGEHATRLWRASDGHLLHELKGHKALVTSVAFSPDGKTLATGAYDQTVRLWNVSDGKRMGIPFRHKHYVWSIAFLSDGSLLVSGSGAMNNGLVGVWRVSDRKLLHQHPQTELVKTIAISPDDRLGVCGMGQIAEEPARVWQVSDGEFQVMLDEKNVESVAFSPDGRTIATGGYKVKIWNASDGKLIRTLEGNTSTISSVAFSPNGSFLAAADDQTLMIWNVSNGKLLHSLHEHKKRINGLAFSPDGKMIATGGDDDCVRTWSVQ